MSKRSVAVIFGGASSEYEVSLRSASFVISGVDREKYDLTMVGITKKGQWFLYTGPENAIADDSWNRPEYVTPAVLPPDPSYHGLLVFSPDGVRTIQLDAVFPVLHGKKRRGRHHSGSISDGADSFCGMRCAVQCCLHG